MPRGPIRRAQLIAPFGVGAMIVMPAGTSLIAAGLDHWYEPESGDTSRDRVDIEEFKVEEWRLEAALGASHFRLPPDYRRRRDSARNYDLTIPFFRFPKWHVCPRCDLLKELPLTQRQKEECPECRAKGEKRYMVQVPFVAMCDRGHLQDFPWREWAHKTARPQCGQPMHLKATGMAGLPGQKVKCQCGAERTLAHITDASADHATTVLTRGLRGRAPVLVSGTKALARPERPERTL